MARVFLVLLVVAALGGVLWVVATAREPRGRTSVAAEAVERDAGAASPPAPILAAQSLAGEQRSPTAATRSEPKSTAKSARTTATTPRDEELARAQWVTGRLVFPPGTPADEEAWVVAKGRSFADDVDHRARVEPDGSFRVAFSEKSRTGRIELDARYLRLPDPGRWNRGQDDVVLEPELGARLAGVLRVPPGAEVPRDGHVQLVWEAGAFFENAILSAAAPDKEHRFAFDALPSGSCHLEYDGPRWVGRSARIDVEPGKTSAVELELALGVVLSGRVRDEQGAPLGDVEVRARSSVRTREIADDRVATSAEDGTFTLAALTAGKLELETRAKGFRPLELDLGVLEEGATNSDLVLVLERGHSIAGVVRWPDGTPAEANVELTPLRNEPMFDRWERPSQGKSGADGRFVVTGLGTGSYRVEARAMKKDSVAVTSELTGRERQKTVRTSLRAERAEVAADTQDVELVLSSGLAVEGRVVDDLGRALADFRVEATRIDARSPWGLDEGTLAKSFRDTDGSFRLEGFAPADWELTATSREHGASEPVRVSVPDAGPVRLVVPRAASVSGVVLDADGEPVEGARVQLVRRTRPGDFTTDDSDSDRTDAAGRFRIDGFSPGTVTVTATAPPAGPSEARVLELVAAEEASDVVLHLRRGATLRGQVLDGSGNGDAGAAISFDQPNDNLVTDEDGRFEARGLAPGELHVWARTLDGLSLSGGVTLADGETAELVLRRPAGRTVRLHGAVRAGGEAASKGNVHLTFETPENLGARAGTSADIRDGAYELTLPSAGSYRVWVALTLPSSDAWLSWSARLDVPDVADFEFDVDVALGRVSGRVTGSDGQPLADVQVRSTPEQHENAAGSARVLTDDQGRYALELPAGRHAVTAGGSGGFGQRKADYCEASATGLVVTAGNELRDVDLVLVKGGTLSGSVRLADGSLAEQAMIWSESNGEPRTIGFGNAGLFVVEGLEPGTHWIGASQGTNATTRAPTRVEIVAGETSELELVLVPAATIHVRALGPTGASIGCDIDAQGSDGRMLRIQRGETGEAWLGPLVRGTYTVRARRDAKTLEREVELTGTEGTLEVELRFE